jgi:hypothetical protein
MLGSSRNRKSAQETTDQQGGKQESKHRIALRMMESMIGNRSENCRGIKQPSPAAQG